MELKNALRRAAEGSATVVPTLLRPLDPDGLFGEAVLPGELLALVQAVPQRGSGLAGTAVFACSGWAAMQRLESIAAAQHSA